MNHPEFVSSWLLEGPAKWLDDRGVSHGLGVFETMLVADGRVVEPELHLERFQAGCDRLGISLPHWEQVLERILLHGAEFESNRLRARVIRTSGRGGLMEIGGDGESTLLTLVPWTAPPAGLRVAVASWIRDERGPLAGVKCTSYADHLMALRQAVHSAGVDEFLFANSQGEWCEGTTSNGFAVIDGQFVTPPLSSGCLAGTMRARVIRWAAEAGHPCTERPIGMAELERASEMFLTSAIRGPVPVLEFQGSSLPEGELVRLFQRQWRRSLGSGVD